MTTKRDLFRESIERIAKSRSMLQKHPDLVRDIRKVLALKKRIEKEKKRPKSKRRKK